MPVVLEIRLHNLVPIIVFDLLIGLREIGDLSRQEVRERIARGDSRIGIVKTKYTLNVRTVEFILLRGHHIRAEEQVMTSYDPGQLVLVRISRVRVIPG